MAEEPEFEYDVFISYSSHDRQWVRNDLLTRIESAGFRAFIDFRDFSRGAPSIKEMERGVRRCRKTFLILTPAYIESAWCDLETIMLQTLSPANQDLRLIPILKSPCNKPLRISALTHIDFTEHADIDLAWKQLIESLAITATTPDKEPALPSDIKADLEQTKALLDADRHATAIPLLEAVLPRADESEHVTARIKVRLSLAHALYDAREDFENAERLYREALAIVPHQDLDLRHSVVHGLSDMLLLAGRLDEANAAIDLGIDIARQAGNVEDLSASLISRALLERTLGFHDRANATLDEVIRLLLKHDLSAKQEAKITIARTLAICYINKAQICTDDGNHHEALALFAKAEEQHRVSGDKLDAGKALLFCGSVHCANADWEQGFDCFVRALEVFKDIENPLWGARSLDHISRVYATHENWEQALQAMLTAAAGAAQAGNPGEQVQFLCLAAKLLREWKTKIARNDVSRMIHRAATRTSDADKAHAMAQLSKQTDQLHEAIDKAVREDKEVRDALHRAKEIAENAHLQEHLANCLLDEAHHMTAPDATDTRHNLITRAIALLTEKLQQAQSPTRRGHLMGRISNLYHELDNETEALTWLRRAGDLFEKSGNALDLAQFHAALADRCHAEGRLDDEITAARQVLAIIHGRSFHHLAAGTKINLAAALRHRKEFSEALQLLTEAEAIADRHHYKEFITAIARHRTDITAHLETTQTPSTTFSDALDSLHQLITYKPELADAYLAFWYFAWGKELLALLRSGPHLTFLVVTDDVAQFLAFAGTFRHAADYFVMATATHPTVEVETGILPIPPPWLFPASFPFLAMIRKEPGTPTEQDAHNDEDDDTPPDFQRVGPATMMPAYMMIDHKSTVPGEGGVMALATPSLPPEAVDLMLHRPIAELVQLRALWAPVARFDAKDVLLHDLRLGYELGLLPIYIGRVPASDAVTVAGAVHVAMPRSLLNGEHPRAATKWKRSLLKLVTLRNDERATLLNLPDSFAEEDQSADSMTVEIRLFEFRHAGQHRCYPALLIRE